MFGDFTLQGNLHLRPALDSDAGFMQTLYRCTRDDLRLADAEADFIEAMIDQQQQAQVQGYGEQFPNALYFIVEYLREPIGRLVLNITETEVLIVDLAFIQAARGKGYGGNILQGLQSAAAQVQAPLLLSVHPMNLKAQKLYARMGFQVTESGPTLIRMRWIPPAKR